MLIDGSGLQLVVTVKVNGVPVVPVAEPALVKLGLAIPGNATTRLRAWVAVGPTPLVALKLIGYVPAEVQAGTPANEAVPLPLSAKLTPVGRVAPLSEIAGFVGPLVVVTVKLDDCPAVSEAFAGLVKAVPSGTVTVEPFEVTVLLAESVADAVAVLDTAPAFKSTEVVV
jgi:hypothetical protein